VEFIRIYRLKPAEGKAEQLTAALAELAEVIGAFAGSQRREMYRDRADGSYVEMPREVFSPIMAAIEGPPQVQTLDRLTFEGRA
jgi:hypothetical protein